MANNTRKPRLVIRASELTNKTHTQIIKMTDAEYEEIVGFLKDRFSARKIQDILPQNTPAEREFILTGITAEEWALALGGDDED